MKNLILLLTTSLIFASCSEEIKKESLTTEVKSENIIEKENVISEFSNPAIIYGTDFLTFFKSLRKLGNYDEMVKFTASESVEKYGEEELRLYYENSFTNMSNSKLKNLEKIDDSNYIMHYLNSEFATKRAFQLNVKLENDSVKLVLDKKYPF